MIVSLSIRDFVLFERVDLDLGLGLTVLTGGSGEGKTLLLDALRFALGQGGGGQVAAERLVRAGAREANVALVLDPRARVTLSDLLEGASEASGPMRLERALTRGGRGRCAIDGEPIPLATLRAIGARIAQLHGQGDGWRLTEEPQQRKLLDAFACLTETAEAYGAERERTIGLAREHDRLARDEADHEAVWSDGHGEREALAELDPEPNEYPDLEARLEDLQARAEREAALSGAAQRLCGDDALEDGLLAVASAITRIEEESCPSREDADEAGSSSLEAIARKVEEAADLAREAALLLSNALEACRVNPRELEALRDRRRAYDSVARRLGVRPDALAERWASLQAQDPEALARRRAALARTALAGRKRLDTLGRILSEGRRVAATKLAAKVTRTLRRSLGLAKGRFAVDLEGALPGPSSVCADDSSAGLLTPLIRAHPSPSGAERVCFGFSAREGDPAELSHASGGELSRLFLAIGRHIAEGGGAGLLVFDEVDQNVGARLGGAVGDCLAAMARGRQVLVVTHLAPVAARAQRHVTVVSEDDVPGVVDLEGEARVQELALMIRGSLTAAALEQARELLGASKPRRRKRRTKVSAA